MPAFYSHPQTIDDLINHSVGRVLDLFDVDAGILKRWEGQNSRSDKPPENKELDESNAPRKVFGLE
jgi:4-hydroxy-3-polyprenylbenzoate decarboxylase